MANKPKKLTPRLAIEYHCWQCLGLYMDGKIDCQSVACPLYPWMPYRRLEPRFTMISYSPRRRGKVLWEDCSPKLTDEQKKEIVKRLRGKKTDKK